jgi:hypothetical protein
MKKNCSSLLNQLRLAGLLLIPTALMTFAAPPVKELVLYYPLDAIGQRQIKDFSGQNNNGKTSTIIVSNSASLVSMQQTRKLTIAVWIKPNSIPSEFPILLSKGLTNPNSTGYGGYQLTLNANGDNDLAFYSGGYTVVTYHANGRWINNHIGEWIHVVFTINDQTKAAKFYVNGQPTGDEMVFGDNISPLNFDVPYNLYIGEPGPENYPASSKFDGSMQNLMLFNRDLTPVEIKKIYTNTKPATPK